MKQTIRQSNGDYRVLSSGGGKYYSVEMFGEHAASCECAHFRLGHATCKHMTSAEEAEKQFQKTQQGEAPPPPFLEAELTRRAGFTLLK